MRELQNEIEHAIALADRLRVDVVDLPEEVRLSVPGPSSTDLTLPLAEIWRRYTLAVRESNVGNLSRTAQ